VEESIAEVAFGMHSFDDLTAFCIEKDSLKHRVWVGGEDDWLVIWDNKCSLTLNNLVTGDTIPLSSLPTMGQFEISPCYKPRSHKLRRIVLCQTPSSKNGFLAIAFFHDGLMASTSKGDLGWKTFWHSTFWEGCKEYYILPNVDVILHRGRLLSVDNSGCIYSWDIKRPDEYALRMGYPYIPHKHFQESPEITFYLAKSPVGELLVIYVHGNEKMYYDPSCQVFRYYAPPSSRRVLVNVHDNFYNIHAMTVYKFDDAKLSWERIHTIGCKHSIFVGLNYPFHMEIEWIKPNSVCVADLDDTDVIIFSMELGKEQSMQLIDLPIKKDAFVEQSFYENTDVVPPNTTVRSKEATLIYYHFRLDYNEVFILREI
jgi:hypothetical protein